MDQCAMKDGSHPSRPLPRPRPGVWGSAVWGSGVWGSGVWASGVWLAISLSAILTSAAPAFGQGALYESIGRGDLTDEEKTALNTLVSDFGFTDLAAL